MTRATEQGVDVAGVAATLAGLATQVAHSRLREAVGFYLRHLDPDGTEPDPTEGRSLTMSRLLGGAFSGTFSLDAVGGEKVATAIESIARRPGAPGTPAPPPRSAVTPWSSCATWRWPPVSYRSCGP